MSSPRNKRRLLIASVAAAAAAVVVGFSVPMATAESNSSGVDTSDHKANAEVLDPKCEVPPEHDPNVIKTLYDIGKERQVTDKVMLAMFEAGWVESHMNNLDCGDSDSIGVFQQRPSMGWCDPAELCMDVPHATNKFLDQAIPNDQNDPNLTAGLLADSVQRSCCPERYDEAEAKAKELLDEASKA